MLIGHKYWQFLINLLSYFFKFLILVRLKPSQIFKKFDTFTVQFYILAYLILWIVLNALSMQVFAQSRGNQPINQTLNLANIPLASKQAFKLTIQKNYTKQGQINGLMLNFEIRQGYWLYKHGFDILINQKQSPLMQPLYPKAKKIFDPILNKQVTYYDAPMQIFLPFKASVLQQSHIANFQLKVVYQGCYVAGGLCYQPDFSIYTFTHNAQNKNSQHQTNEINNPNAHKAKFSFQNNLRLNDTHPFAQNTNQQTLNKTFIEDKTLQAIQSEHQKNTKNTSNWLYKQTKQTQETETQDINDHPNNTQPLQPSAFAKQNIALNEISDTGTIEKNSNPYARKPKTDNNQPTEKNNHNYVYWLFLPLCVGCMSIIAWLASKDNHQDDWH